MIEWTMFKFDLGLRKLFPEWKKLFTTENLLPDLFAGISVTCVAIPLSLAIALASGVEPGIGLITAIIAGILCALFGGTTLAVSGPAAAMSILVLEIVQKFGFSSLILIGFVAGFMQIVSGILGLGRLARFVPVPVIAGFTAGIGFIIILGQLPRAFGLAPPAEVSIVGVVSHIKEYLHEINGACILLVVITIATIHLSNKISKKLPAILIAVIVATVMAYLFGLTVPVIGAIPDTLPSPHLPKLNAMPYGEIIFNGFIIYLLASIETLLSSSAVDKLAKGKKHDPDQELIGQGIGNVIVSLFGGMPATGVIARSAINVKAGAKTRRASIIHSLGILLAILVISPVISAIPIAALSGVLFFVAFYMLSYREFINLWQSARTDAFVYAATFVTIVVADLLAGIQAGIIAAYLIVLLRASKTHFHLSTTSQDDITRITLVGALTFLSTGKLAKVQKQLENVRNQTILIDLANIRNVDVSGASAIVDLYQFCKNNENHFFIKGLPRRFELVFRLCDGAELLDNYYLLSDHDLRKRLSPSVLKTSYGRLVHGIYRFYIERKHNDKRLFEFISQKQDPHTLFITCSDSRIIPSMITSADPGELFIVRNIGNFVPPYDKHSICSESAAIQFALSSFDITDIVICGHAHCGAINACKHVNTISENSLHSWIKKIQMQLGNCDHEVNDLVKMNVINQINNLKTYPLVAEKIANTTLNIHGWFFDFDESLIYEWIHQEGGFKSILPLPEPDVA